MSSRLSRHCLTLVALLAAHHPRSFHVSCQTLHARTLQRHEKVPSHSSRIDLQLAEHDRAASRLAGRNQSQPTISTSTAGRSTAAAAPAGAFQTWSRHSCSPCVLRVLLSAGSASCDSIPRGACRLCAVRARPSILLPRRDCDNAQHRKRNALRADQPAGAGPRGQQKLLCSAAPRSEWSAPQLGGGLPGVWGSDLAYHEGTPCLQAVCCAFCT